MSDLKKIVEDSFSRYAGAVIANRAICDARDMLKPSTRMLLYSQKETTKNTSDKPFVKSARVVGDALGHWYTHGDSSCYGTYMRMGKTFAMRYPLEECQGNAGTIIMPGDEAASRYTELRLSKLGDYLFRNIKKDCIEEWENNFDDTEQYPRVLPSLGFYNIVNGSTGIGVSLSSSICQYNLRETNEAMIKLLWNEDEPDENILCMPDFATGATILNGEEIKQSLLNGTGPAVKMRATIEYDSDHNELIVTELPYSVYTSTITAQIQKLLEKEPNCGIIGINDGSGKTPNYIISLKKGTSVSRILKLLYKNTSLQYHYSINMTVLEDGRIPKVYGWRKLLLSHIHHEEEVYTRAFQYDLKKIWARLHIIEGLLKAYDVIDEVIQLIKKSKNVTEANSALCDFLKIDNVQADAILSMKLSALSKLDITKLKDEQSSLNAEADRITAILTDKSLLKKEVERGLREVIEKFDDERRTKITNVELDEEEEPVDLTKYTISVTNKGRITSTKSSTLYAHKRGTVGKRNKLSNGEYVIGSFSGVNGDNGVFLSKKGVAYSVKFEELISQDKTYLSALCDFEEDDELKACINIPKNSSKKEYIIFVTKHGYIKKSELSEYRFNIQKGVRALVLEDGDEVVSIILTNSENIGILTHKGMFIITQTSDIRAIGRTARGVVGIKLATDDYVVSSRIVCDKTNQLLFVMEDGNGYKVDKNIFSAVGRGAKGRNISNKKDFVIDFLTIDENIDIMIISNEATVVINTKDIPSVKTIGATGVKLINLKERSKIKKVEKVTL